MPNMSLLSSLTHPHTLHVIENKQSALLLSLYMYMYAFQTSLYLSKINTFLLRFRFILHWKTAGQKYDIKNFVFKSHFEILRFCRPLNINTVCYGCYSAMGFVCIFRIQCEHEICWLYLFPCHVYDDAELKNCKTYSCSSISAAAPCIQGRFFVVCSNACVMHCNPIMQYWYVR